MLAVVMGGVCETSIKKLLTCLLAVLYDRLLIQCPWKVRGRYEGSNTSSNENGSRSSDPLSAESNRHRSVYNIDVSWR